MPKALCFFGIAVAALLLLLFGLDLAAEIPFGRESVAMDVGFIVCAAALGTSVGARCASRSEDPLVPAAFGSQHWMASARPSIV